MTVSPPIIIPVIPIIKKNTIKSKMSKHALVVLDKWEGSLSINMLIS